MTNNLPVSIHAPQKNFNVIVEYDPSWPLHFDAEARRISSALGNFHMTLNHIGSTSVPGLPAKPTIDILGVIPAGAHLPDPHSLERLGYSAKGAHGIPGRRFFQKRDTQGARTHHLHVFRQGAQAVRDHLAFRDYLRAHPDVAADYGALKRGLIADPSLTRAGYQSAKSPKIRAILDDARIWFATAPTDKGSSGR